MKFLACLLAFLAFILTGFSWKCVVYYSVFGFISWWLIYVFLSSKCELDFEVLFKVFEWFGYGAPHFLENRGLSSPENTTDGQASLSGIPEPISRRIDVVIQNVSRDFVGSWYREVAEGDVFIEESKAALRILSLEVYNRMANLDSHHLSEQVIMVFHAHLERFNKAVCVVKDKDPKLKLPITSSQLLHQVYESQIPTKHLALKNPSSELNYLRTVVDSLLAALLPPNIFSCDMGRFILREILAVQLVDLVDMLCDGDWVNEAVIDLLSPPKKHLSDVCKDQKLHDEISSDQAIKKGLGSIGNVGLISPTVINGDMDGILPTGAEDEGKIISSKTQVVIFASEGQHQTDLEILDNDIQIRDDEECTLDQSNGQLGSHSNPIMNENTTANSDSVHGNVICQEDTEKDLGTFSTGLSSSWGYLPSSGDKTFQTQSFEAMKQKAIERERLKNSSTKFANFGNEMKRLSTCCTRFDVSDEVDGSLKNKFVQMRKRTASLPEELDVVANGISQQNKILGSSRSKSFQRSVSFPNNLSSVLESDQPLDPVERPLRSSTIHPTPVYGSPYYNLSFCSSEGSFKSFSDDDIDVEEGEEMDEGTDSDDNEMLEDIAPLPIMKAPPKSSLATEIDHVNGNSRIYKDSIRQRKHGFVKSKGIMQDGYQGNAGIAGSNDETYGKNSFDSYHDNRYSSKDSDSSDPRSPMESASKPRRLESDPSFSDSVILAGKKFISSIKSPVKKFGFSSGSSKSTSTSSGADSLEVNVPSSIDTASFDSDLPFHRPVIKTKTDSPSSGRKLSRSQAVVEVSSESETETWYGTPTEAVREEIAYEVPSSSSGDTTDSENRTVKKRIHPSRLISIPSSETALESEWEPGRSKFTLYRIEYDIRIWPSVYQEEIEEESQLQSAEEKEEDPNKKKTIPYKRAIKRRYREFMELHSRLCSGSVAIYMKDILKPNRKYNLPFGRLDKEVVEGRRCLLQNYLVSLVSKQELRDCDDLKQFLGVIGGVSFIKPSVAQIMSQSVHVPRVDKMLSRQMTKVIDSIKTALELEDQAEPEAAATTPAAIDTSCPWTIIHHSSIDEHPLMEKEEVSAGDCFSAFLGSLQLSHLTYHDNDTDDSYEVSSGDDDDDEDDDDDLYLLGPKSVDDTRDTPNEPSATSPISQDDMLNGILGSKPPGLCIPPTLPHSVSTGSLNDKDTIDFGKQWFHKDMPEKKVKPVFPERPPPPAVPPHPSNEPVDPASEQEKAKFSHQLKFSKTNVEKLKVAAQRAKEKRIESMENLSHAKEKVKMFSKEKKAETAEHLSHAKDKVKTFSKEKKMETVEHLSHAKDKVKAFSKEKKLDSVEHFTHAKDKVKHFSKDKKAETIEHLNQAKEKVKSFSKDTKLEEQLSHAKDKVKAYSKEMKVETMDNLGQAKEKVKAFSKEKKIETAEHLSHAKDKVTAYSKEKKEESLENLHQAKEKVKAFQRKISDSKKLIKKEQTGQSSPSEGGVELYPGSAMFDARKTAVQSSKVNEGRTDVPCVVSSCDDPSSVNDITQDTIVDELQCPLAHAILDLTCEVLKGHDSWAGIDRVQDAFLGSFGALFEWFVRSEIDDLFTDDNWGLYLENLIQVVWPDGKLIEPSGVQKSEDEKERTKKKAIKTLMEFFPDLFPLCVGTWVYKDCASNAVESLQNTAINRILIYLLLELFLAELIPEMQHIMYMDGQGHPE